MNDPGQNEFWREVAGANERARGKRSSVATVRARLLAGESPAERAQSTKWLWLGAAAAVAVAAIFGSISLFRSRALAFHVDRAAGVLGAPVAAPGAKHALIAFSDGSTFDLEPQAQARVVRVEEHGAAIVLARGAANVSIVPRAGNDFRVLVGSFEVAVTGTQFKVSWDAAREQLDFDLFKGSVVISGPCLKEARSLHAGQSLHASCRPALEATVPPAADSSAAPPAPANSAGPISVVVDLDQAWRKLIQRHDYAPALAAAEHAGFAGVCQRASGSELVALGDAARLSGNPARAVDAYQAAHRKQGGAGRSAFGIGLVEFDARHFARAAEWFSTYLREQPNGPLAEEAAGRSMESYSRAGQPEKGRELATQYLARHPSGMYADLARRLLAP